MQPCTAPQNTSRELADDMLRGADAIGEFLFGGSYGDQRKRNRRKVYYLAKCTKLPVYRLGSILCARKSNLLKFISAQENRVLRICEEVSIPDVSR